MSRKYMEMKVVGFEPELKEFVRVCQMIQECGRVGTCRTIPVVVDGDGSGKLSFEVNGERIPPLDRMSDDEPLPKMWIGE